MLARRLVPTVIQSDHAFEVEATAGEADIASLANSPCGAEFARERDMPFTWDEITGGVAGTKYGRSLY